jgi:hypothetical protein
VQPSAATPREFEETGSLITARTSHTATLMPNGDVFVVGGFSGTSLASAERYNPATGTWSRVIGLQKAIAEHTATLLRDGNVLLAGGFGGTGAVALLFDARLELDPHRQPHHLVMNTATLLPNGNVLVIGGMASQSTRPRPQNLIR